MIPIMFMRKKNQINNFTTIAISKNTKEKLQRLGKFGQSFNDLISELIQAWK